MTATAADALRMLAPSTPEEWPAGILAAAGIRQARAEAATPGPYSVGVKGGRDYNDEWWRDVTLDMPEAGCTGAQFGEYEGAQADAEHIAAEANPAHALAAVRHWRSVAERHGPLPDTKPLECSTCVGSWSAEEYANYPCPDLAEVADEARAYLGGAG